MFPPCKFTCNYSVRVHVFVQGTVHEKNSLCLLVAYRGDPVDAAASGSPVVEALGKMS